MIAHGKDIKIFAGNSNRVLAQEICQHLNTKLGDSEVGKFADGECYASLYESVRGSDVFVIQSTCNPVNDNLMEMLVMIDALKRASAGRNHRRDSLFRAMPARTGRPRRETRFRQSWWPI